MLLFISLIFNIWKSWKEDCRHLHGLPFTFEEFSRSSHPGVTELKFLHTVQSCYTFVNTIQVKCLAQGYTGCALPKNSLELQAVTRPLCNTWPLPTVWSLKQRQRILPFILLNSHREVICFQIINCQRNTKYNHVKSILDVDLDFNHFKMGLEKYYSSWIQTWVQTTLNPYTDQYYLTQ